MTEAVPASETESITLIHVYNRPIQNLISFFGVILIHDLTRNAAVAEIADRTAFSRIIVVIMQTMAITDVEIFNLGIVRHDYIRDSVCYEPIRLLNEDLTNLSQRNNS